MLNYYNLIMGSDSSSFLPIFNKLWTKEIESHNLPYTHALQIESGNRLRPLLMAWGYYANCVSKNNLFIADYAISIELLHKASILLDDLIDADIARHERDTFHIQFSKAEAILYAIYILNRGLILIHEKDISNNNLYTSKLLKIVENMARGGIREICSKNAAFNLVDVKEIIELETISLIKNSFVLGYQLSAKTPNDVPDDIVNIGHSCGYCFQVLNDIEPFSAPNINQKYKGIINYDFSKHRKNIVMSFLYGACTQQERDKLATCSDFTYVNKLVSKYEVLSILLTEIETEINSIMKAVSHLEDRNFTFYNAFKSFLVNMFKICYQKCDLPFSENLFNN